MDIILKLKEIIIKSMELDLTPNEIDGSDLIYELGINSVDALEILVWVESEFDIQIEDEDLNAELLSSLDGLSTYVTSKIR